MSFLMDGSNFPPCTYNGLPHYTEQIKVLEETGKLERSVFMENS